MCLRRSMPRGARRSLRRVRRCRSPRTGPRRRKARPMGLGTAESAICERFSDTSCSPVKFRETEAPTTVVWW